MNAHVDVHAGWQCADLSPTVTPLHGQQGLLPRSNQRYQLPVSRTTLPPRT